MKFSVITVNFNNKNGLEKTIQSVLSQTYADYEYIIVDGGSTDGSREAIEHYKKSFSWWCSEPDKGVYNAMNKGIDHAIGDYVIFMNSGDVFYDVNVLNNVALANPRADVVYGDWIRWFDSQKEFLTQAPKNANFSFFLSGNNICHQAMFIRRELHQKEKYEEKFKILADWALWQKLSFKKHSFKYLPYTICRFDANSGLSETCSEIMKKERRMIRLRYPVQFLCVKLCEFLFTRI